MTAAGSRLIPALETILRSRGIEPDISEGGRRDAAAVRTDGDTLSAVISTAGLQTPDYIERQIALTADALTAVPEGYFGTLAFLFRAAKIASGGFSVPREPGREALTARKRPKYLSPDDLYCSAAPEASVTAEIAYDGGREPVFSVLKLIRGLPRTRAARRFPALESLDALAGGDIMSLTVPELIRAYSETGNGFIGGLAVRLFALSPDAPALSGGERETAAALASVYAGECVRLIEAADGLAPCALTDARAAAVKTLAALRERLGPGIRAAGGMTVLT